MIVNWERVRSAESLLEIRGIYSIALIKVVDEHGKIYYCFERAGRQVGQESIMIERRQLQLLMAGVDRDILLDDALAAKRPK